ncbi:hypothetical protein BLOT_010299, partial [Blomia tropicalis]
MLIKPNQFNLLQMVYKFTQTIRRTILIDEILHQNDKHSFLASNDLKDQNTNTKDLFNDIQIDQELSSSHFETTI